MQAYIQTVVGIRTRDLDTEDYLRIRENDSYDNIDSCGEGYVATQEGEIIVLEIKNNPFVGESHFLTSEQINSFTFNVDDYDSILEENGWTSYKKDIHLYTYCVEI